MLAPRVALSVCSGLPVALVPAYTLTVTLAVSPTALPALPPNVGSVVASVALLAGCVSVTFGAVVSFTSRTSCGAFDDSLLANVLPGDAVLVRANVTVALALTSGVTSSVIQSPAVKAPEEAVIADDGVGEDLNVMFPSFQLFDADRTTNPVAELSVAWRRSVALLRGPGSAGTLNFR